MTTQPQPTSSTSTTNPATSPRKRSRAASSVHKSLFIVESPTKVPTIEKYLDSSFVVAATVGHIADIPSREGMVDVNNDFAASYELTEKGKAVISDLKKLMKGCSEVIVATDADREGELIAAHVLTFLAPTVPVKRVTFHAVTKDEIENALRHPREIDWNLVEAAQARRILDRLFGFEVSDISRRKVRKDTTAGRVQSPALRLVVEREFERMNFVSASYADVVAQCATTPTLTAMLKKCDDRPIALGKDFNSQAELISDAFVLSMDDASAIAVDLEQGVRNLIVVDITEKSLTRQPQPPFIMSTLYQDAFTRLGMSMKEAQSTSGMLFDKGLITYPRTDNPVHDPGSRRAIRSAIETQFGRDLVAPFERYASSKKKVQGAHEAIRPTNLQLVQPKGLTERQQAMYQMIWQRTLASQMTEAKGTTKTVTLLATDGGRSLEFSSSGTVYHQLGYRSVYAPTHDDEASSSLPDLAVGEIIAVSYAQGRDHHTTPPARFNDGSLVKKLEELGIGRPSTYASIIAKLRERYVWSKKNDRGMIPTVTAFALHRLLTMNFSQLLDYSFTSDLEEKLDEVANDQSLRHVLLKDFYFGTAKSDGLHALVTNASVNVNGKDMYALSFGKHPETGDEIIVRAGRLFGKDGRPYIECGATTVPIADQTEFADLSMDAVLRLLAKSAPHLLGHIDDVPVFVRYTETGSYLQWGEKDNLPNGAKKPRSISLLSTMDPDAVTVEEARLMFSLPRTVGISPNGDVITATVGRYGGYISCGSETRSLKDDTRVFSITEEEAIELLNAPKPQRQGKAALGRKRKKS